MTVKNSPTPKKEKCTLFLLSFARLSFRNFRDCNKKRRELFTQMKLYTMVRNLNHKNLINMVNTTYTPYVSELTWLNNEAHEF